MLILHQQVVYLKMKHEDIYQSIGCIFGLLHDTIGKENHCIPCMEFSSVSFATALVDLALFHLAKRS